MSSNRFTNDIASDPTLQDAIHPMTPANVFMIYFFTYTVFGFASSFLSEHVSRKSSASADKLWYTYCLNLGQWREYYFAFAIHVLNEASSLAAMVAMYRVCQDMYGVDTDDWKWMTRQPMPSMLLLVSLIIWSAYKLSSTLYLITIDIFSWLQVFLHLIDCNYLYEMHIAHSTDNKNPIIEWMHRQYVYCCSIPLWFCQFVFLLRWSHLIRDDDHKPLFAVLVLANLCGLANIFAVLLWCDQRSFNSDSQKWHQRGFRVRFAYRGCQFISRMVWLAFFWIFLGSAPFFILCLLLLCNHIFLYVKGYFADFVHVLTNFFIVPDMSIGLGVRGEQKVDWAAKLLYMITHCAGCIIGVYVIRDEEAFVLLDMLCWLHWFEDLLLWAVITGFCDQQPSQSESTILSPPNLWPQIWTQPRYEGFYALGIICWFFAGGYFLVLRWEDFIDPQKQSLSITQGILGLAENGEWESLEKFLPRMKKLSVNRKNLLHEGKTALHYAVEQDKWSIARKLLEYGANVNITDRQHQTAVHLLCSNAKLSDLSLLKQFLSAFEGNPNMRRDSHGRTLLHLICSTESTNLAAAEKLKSYFEIFGRGAENATHVDVNIADNDGCTPLHYLVRECNEQSAIEFLMDAGAEVDVLDNQQRTPLIHAVSKSQDHPTTIRYLLDREANLNHQDDKGWTALHHACNHSGNLIDNVLILLEYFPDLTLRNHAGKNAYNLALSQGNGMIADTLKLNMPSEELVELTPMQMNELQHKRQQGGDTAAAATVDTLAAVGANDGGNTSQQHLMTASPPQQQNQIEEEEKESAAEVVVIDDDIPLPPEPMEDDIPLPPEPMEVVVVDDEQNNEENEIGNDKNDGNIEQDELPTKNDEI